MSGTRRTEDFNAVNTRQLNLINPDGSFPAQGQLIGVTDSYGSLGPTPNPVFEHVTTRTLSVMSPSFQATVNATTVVADTVRTSTLDVINNGRLNVYDLCANRIDTVYLTVADVSANCVTVDSIYPRQIGSGAKPANIANINNVYATDISASQLRSSNINVGTLYATDISSTRIYAQQIMTNDLATKTISQAYSINTLALTAGTADISGLTVRNTVSTRLTSTDISSTNIFATNAIISGNLTTNGIFNPANISTVNSFTARDISATNIVGGTATFDKLNIQRADVDISGYYYPSLSAGVFTGNTINAGKLDVSGTTTLNNTSIGTSLAVTGLTTTNSLIAEQQIIAPVVTATSSLQVGTVGGTSEITIIDKTKALSNIPPNPGILTYDISNGLLLNGLLVSSNAALANTRPFSIVTPVNNLATVIDISATLFNLIASYNAFLQIFNDAKIIIQLTPVVFFNSPCSIQFDICGTLVPPLILSGRYQLTSTQGDASTLTGILTAAAKNVIRFVANQDLELNQWKVSINVVNPGVNTYIRDISGLPTGSLQVLRTIGFNVPTGGPNPYETYALNGSLTEYIRTDFFLSEGTSLGAPLPSSIAYPNNLSVPVYTVSGDPYSLPITFTNLVGTNVQYLAIKFNGAYNLYPNTYRDISYSGLTPNTSYPFIFNYLDQYNNSSVSPLLSTTKIPIPKNISTNSVTFNSFGVTWLQPYEGKTYTFKIDTSGNYITSIPNYSGTSITFSSLLRNSQYSVILTSYEAAFSAYSDPAPIIIINTPDLIVPTAVIRDISNSNITKQFNWATSVPSGVIGELNYVVNNGAPTRYVIPGTDISYNITGLVGIGDISCSLLYTDNSYNTVQGNITTFSYDTSFGYYDMSATSVSISLDNINTLKGVGYVFPATLRLDPYTGANPWIGYTFNRILFSKGITETTGNNVTFRAEVYNVTSDINGLYGTGSVTPFDLSNNATLVTVSTPDTAISGSSTAYPILTFSTPVVISATTMILFVLTGGSVGSLSFRTFLNTDPINSGYAKIAYGTSVGYQFSLGTGTLNNFSTGARNAVICQFNYV